ncbi:MAG: hypothetical protein OZSIB_1886 [Candidatus Ozemobacter sibiricus]|jgi:hypothetical protein|uniref:Uncharacterized protein n=1 Tax=Candidatus Ozemobacter sibiricus TaxID=2268124 RepID=A0A367ZJE7_9BACT|nr:MAG: hypothetical protein OZSIB_1886 [Candidatus Ozemobacter sibiricus]
MALRPVMPSGEDVLLLLLLVGRKSVPDGLVGFGGDPEGQKGSRPAGVLLF